MADDRIGGPAAQPDRFHHRVDGQPSTQAAKKTAEVQQSTAPTVSHVKEGSEALPTKKTEAAPLDPAHPALVLPSITLSAEEADKMQKDLKRKFDEPVPPKVLKKRVSEGSEKFKAKLEAAAQEIDKIGKSNTSFDYKMMQIQKILAETLQNSLEIGGEFAKFISFQQAEASKEANAQRLEQLENDQKSKTIRIITKVFAVIGELFNLVAAAFTTMAALTATFATGATAAPILLAAGMWLSGAIMGLGLRTNELANEINPDLKTLPEGASATALTTIQMILSLGGMLATGGLTAYASRATTALVESSETVNLTAKAINSTSSIAALDANIAAATAAGDAAGALAITTAKNALIKAATKAEAAAEAIIDAAENATITKQLIQNTIDKTKKLQTAIKTYQQYLPSIINKQAQKGFDAAAQNLANLTTRSMEQIEELNGITVQIQTVLERYHMATQGFTAATEGVIMPAVSQYHQYMISKAEVRKTEQDKLINALKFVSDNTSQRIEDSLKGFTDLTKSQAEFIKKRSNLSGMITGNI